MTDNMPLEIPSELGLNRSEQTVLLHLLQSGSSSPGRVSLATKTKRPTVYAALEGLVNLGLVLRTQRQGHTVFSAVPRELVPKILEEHAKRSYETTKSNLRTLQSLLARLPKHEQVNLAGFEISTLKSTEAVYSSLWEILQKGDYLAIFNPQLLPKGQLQDGALKFLRETAHTKPRIRELVVPGPATRWYRSNIRNENHAVRELPPGRVFLSDIILMNGLTYIGRYVQNQELAIEINEPCLFTSLITVFEVMWERLG